MTIEVKILMTCIWNMEWFWIGYKEKH